MYLAETLCGLTGSIITGLAYAKANKDTKWSSKLGLAAVIGVILMVLGFISMMRDIGGV